MSLEQRRLGWFAVGILVVTSLLLTVFAPRSRPPLEPLPHELDALRGEQEQPQAAALTALQVRLSKQDPSAQVLILQGAPGSPPVVARNVVDEDGSEAATHWLAPWPAVIRAMSQPVVSSSLVSGTYAGSRFQHRLIPLEPSGTRLLLINSAEMPRSAWSMRNLLLLGTALLATALLLARRKD